MIHAKYPRTFHLPWSPGISSDDKVVDSIDQFRGKYVVVTEKLDGENTSLYRDGFHARSINQNGLHWSQVSVQEFHSFNRDLIPEDVCLVVENMTATHSIPYNNLSNFLYGIAVIAETEKGRFVTSCAENSYWFGKLGLPMPRRLYNGVFNESVLRDIEKDLDFTKCEGYVIRRGDGFFESQFSECVAKYVRPKHVQTDEHWKYRKEKIRNRLALTT